MPITFHFHPEANLVIAVHVGTVADDEFLSSYKALYEDPRFDLSSDRLVDLRRTDSSARSTAALRAFAAFAREKHRDTTPRPRFAVIAPRDLSFGLARMYEVFGEGPETEFVVFREADAALAWLRLPEDLADDFEREIPSQDAPVLG